MAMLAHSSWLETDNEKDSQDYDLPSYEAGDTVSSQKTVVTETLVNGKQLALLYH